MLELAVAPAVRRLGWSRRTAATALAAGCFVAGLPTVLSFSVWKHWRPTPFEAVDYLTSNVMLPLGGLALALFAGRVLPARLLAEELRLGPRATATLRFALRWLTPALIAGVALGPLAL
jgi:NSS family neurotransmitter:Na+ symporter